MDCLPRLIVIKSLDTKQNAYYKNETEDVGGYVSCGEENTFSPFAKIEVEVSYFNIKYVHLRFSHTNKYWGKSPTDKWIIASSNQPEEDQSKPSCTLFEPIFENEGQIVHFTHVQSGGNVRVEVDDDANKSRIYVDDHDDNKGSYSKFSYVNWESLVKLPKYVAFKGDNDKYLKVTSSEVDFSGDDLNDEDVTYELFSKPDGQIRIKSVHFDKFWRRTPNSICCDSTSSKDDDIDADTLFWPVKLDGKTIALRSAGNNEFCNRQTSEGKTDCLSAGTKYISKEAKFVVVDLIVERSIHDVRYRMEDARVYDERTFVAVRGGASNTNETEPANLAINFSYTDISSYSFTNSLSVISGVETTIEAGIPLIVGRGKVEVSPDSISTNRLVWGEIIETKKAIEITHTVVVPPKSRINVNFAATGGKCSVPFSYSQRDRMMDGTIVNSEHSDGIFEGANNYEFHIEELPIVAK